MVHLCGQNHSAQQHYFFKKKLQSNALFSRGFSKFVRLQFTHNLRRLIISITKQRMILLIPILSQVQYHSKSQPFFLIQVFLLTLLFLLNYLPLVGLQTHELQVVLFILLMFSPPSQNLYKPQSSFQMVIVCQLPIQAQFNYLKI